MMTIHHLREILGNRPDSGNPKENMP